MQLKKGVKIEGCILIFYNFVRNHLITGTTVNNHRK